MMTHAVCIPRSTASLSPQLDAQSLLGIFQEIEVARFGGQGARPTIHLAGSDRLPCAAFLIGMNKT